MRTAALLFLLNCLLLLTACTSTESTSTTTQTVDRQDYVWLLVSYGNDEQNQTPAAIDANTTIKFNRTSERLITSFSGYDGCNHFSANVISPDTLHFIASDGVDQDGQYCEALQNSTYLLQYDYLYSIFTDFSLHYNSDELLRLRTPDGKLMVLRRCGLIEDQELEQECSLEP